MCVCVCVCVCVPSRVFSRNTVERRLQKVNEKDCTNVMRLGCHGNVISQQKSLITNLPAHLCGIVCDIQGFRG
jgi:hypothetical protein